MKKSSIVVGGVVAVIVIAGAIFLKGKSLSVANNPVNANAQIEQIAKDQKAKENSLSRIRGILTKSGVVSKSDLSSIPELPDGITLLDPSKFISGTLTKYVAGTEYTIISEFKGTQDFDQFGNFYVKQATDKGYKITTNIFARNGTKTIFETKDFEVRAVSYLRQDKETGEIYVKEKITFYILN